MLARLHQGPGSQPWLDRLVGPTDPSAGEVVDLGSEPARQVGRVDPVLDSPVQQLPAPAHPPSLGSAVPADPSRPSIPVTDRLLGDHRDVPRHHPRAGRSGAGPQLAARDVPSWVGALVGLALATYWSVQTGADRRPWAVVADERCRVVDEAVDEADAVDYPGSWRSLGSGASTPSGGRTVCSTAAMTPGAGRVSRLPTRDPRLRTREWLVLDRLDRGDLDGATAEVDRFATQARGTGLVLFARREMLWRANLAMLRGEIDEAVALNRGSSGRHRRRRRVPVLVPERGRHGGHRGRRCAGVWRT